jgi:phosphopantothenoylcysteine decarboxylase/phosphopantothenate--cysteine ligase
MAPAMNARMYCNAVLQRNLEGLKAAGVRFVDPESGILACGVTGQGRLASTEHILQSVHAALSPKDLHGVAVLVTAGPTREPIDAVRFISNPSTGRMGYALAAEARDRGALVTLISGPTHLVPPQDVTTISVTTAEEMGRAVKEHASRCEIIIMAAAVSDFRPAEAVDHKIKKEDAALSVPLTRTEDILRGLGSNKAGCILVGFAAETDDLVKNAGEKLRRKNLDLIVANDVGRRDAGFASENNAAVLIDRMGKIRELPLLPKVELASRIIDAIVELKKNQGV